ncbi:hypothetical protein ACHAXS_012449 [Conticribra weissflogii]
MASASACAVDAISICIFGEDERKMNSTAMGQYCEDDVNSHDEYPAYSYHRIKMRALSIYLIPQLVCFAEELSRLHGLFKNELNIEIDLIG